MLPESLERTEIQQLKGLVETIFNEIKRHHDLNRKLEIRKHLLGPLGEALGIIYLFQEHGSSAKYKWFGGRKKDYDILIEKGDGTLNKIQIKASAAQDYSFEITVKGFRNISEIHKDLSRNDFKKAFAVIEKSVNEKEIDRWLFIHIREDCIDFFLIDKSALYRAIKHDYRRYVEHINQGKNKERNNYAIIDSENPFVRFILKDENVGDIFDGCKVRSSSYFLS